MYRLKQAAILVYKQLVKNLRKDSYKPVEGTTGIWSHSIRQTKFALCVDNFGVKYYLEDDALHFINVLIKHYIVSEDWKGENYCGFDITWNCKKIL